MNIYKMSCDVDYYEKVFNARKQNIYAYKSNIPEISKKAGRDCSHLDFSPGLNELLEDVVFFCETDNSLQSYNYLNNVHGWPIVHERVKDLLTEEHIRGVLFFPLRIIHDKSGLPEHGFYLLYTSNFIEAYDMERSMYKYLEKYNAYMFFPMKTVFVESECSQYDIFRCVKDPVPLYVSQRFYEIIKSAGYEGFSFHKVQ